MRNFGAILSYPGSGYNNFHTAALGGKIKFREVGAPDLEDPIINSEEDLAKLNIEDIDKDETTNTVKAALRRTKENNWRSVCCYHDGLGPLYECSQTLWRRSHDEGNIQKAGSLLRKSSILPPNCSFTSMNPLSVMAPWRSSVWADPTASGDLVSKKQFERFALPYLKKFTDWAKSKNVHTLLHICGDTTDRIDLFPATGASCISVDHKTDIAKTKELLYGKMCFAGNVNPVEIMLQGSAAQVESTCKQIVETAGTDGAFTLMPGCDIPPDVPYENIAKFIQVAQSWKL